MQGSFVNLPKEDPLCFFGKHISYDGEPLTVMGSQISGGLFGPAGTEIGITLGHQTTLGGVGVMAIGKKVAN
jgi:hypothetical protein